MFIYGGFDQDTSDRFYILDLNTMIWTNLKTTNPPQPRKRHTLIGLQNKLYVLGGYWKEDGYSFDIQS